MMKIAVCDDESWALDNLEDLIETENYGEKLEVSSYMSAEELLEDMKNTFFDIIFLDIDMKEMSGIVAGQNIREHYGHGAPIIVYVSSHVDLVMDTFAAYPFQFLSKPLDPYRFRHVLNEAIKVVKKSSDYFVYRKGKNGVYHVSLKSIVMFSSFSRNVLIKGEKTDITYIGKLIDAEKQLESLNARNFVRAHRCSIVNLDHVMQFKKGMFVMDTSDVVTVSLSNEKNVNERMLEYQRRY